MNEEELNAFAALAQANKASEETQTETVTAETVTSDAVKAEAQETVEKVETKTVETENKSVFDVISSLKKGEDSEVKSVELPEEIKARLVLADKYEQFSKTEIAQLLETDLTPLELLNSIQVIDYSKMTPEQLITENAKLIAGDRFTEDMAEEAIEVYNNLPTKLDKIEFEKRLVEKLGQNKTEIKNELVKKIQDYQASKKTQEVPQVDYTQVAKAELGQLTNTLTELTTKHGLSTEIAESLKSLYSIEMAAAFIDKKTNQFDELAFIKHNYKAVAYDSDMATLKANLAQQILEAEERGAKKMAEKLGNPEAFASSGGDVEKTAEQKFKELAL